MKKTLLLTAILLVCGCDLYKVTTKDGDPKGIPFYVKKAACITETVYSKTVYVVSLEIEIETVQGNNDTEPKKTHSYEKIISEDTFDSNSFRTLSRSVRDAERHYSPELEEKIIQAFECLKPCPPYKMFESTCAPCGEPDLISNTARTEVYVDYTKPYYINTERPIVGTVKGITVLNNDGTLGKMEADVTDKTVETIVSALPIKEYISSFLIPPPVSTRDVKMPVRPKPARISLRIEPKVYTLTFFTVDRNLELPCEPAEVSDINLNYRRIEEQKAITKTKPKDKDKKTIGVTGSIVLPK